MLEPDGRLPCDGCTCRRWRRHRQCPPPEKATPPLVSAPRADGSRDGPVRVQAPLLKRGQRKARAGEEESELHNAGKDRKTPPPQPVLFSLYDEERRPASLEEPPGTTGAGPAAHRGAPGRCTCAGHAPHNYMHRLACKGETCLSYTPSAPPQPPQGSNRLRCLLCNPCVLS